MKFSTKKFLKDREKSKKESKKEEEVLKERVKIWNS